MKHRSTVASPHREMYRQQIPLPRHVTKGPIPQKSKRPDSTTVASATGIVSGCVASS